MALKKKSKKIRERVVIQIDGSNFYHRLKEPPVSLKDLLRFDFSRFGKWLAGNRDIIRMNYYVGRVRAHPGDKKAMRLMSDQQRLFAELGDQGWSIFRGFILKTDGVYHEKGVDVKIAADLLVGAYEDQYDTAILVSSDTDLIPAIRKVRQLGKNVEYVGFGHKPSFALQHHCSISRLLVKSDLKQFIQ